MKKFYNNTRYIVKRIYSRVIKIEISFDKFKNKYIMLSRILYNFKKLNFFIILFRNFD
jgi:hypothetical protein